MASTRCVANHSDKLHYSALLACSSGGQVDIVSIEAGRAGVRACVRAT